MYETIQYQLVMNFEIHTRIGVIILEPFLANYYGTSLIPRLLCVALTCVQNILKL